MRSRDKKTLATENTLIRAILMKPGQTAHDLQFAAKIHIRTTQRRLKSLSEDGILEARSEPNGMGYRRVAYYPTPKTRVHNIDELVKVNTPKPASKFAEPQRSAIVIPLPDMSKPVKAGCRYFVARKMCECGSKRFAESSYCEEHLQAVAPRGRGIGGYLSGYTNRQNGSL